MVKKRKNLVWSIAFILPALSLLFVFLLYPVFEAVKLSFYKWTGIASAKPIFIGLEGSISVAKFLAVDAKRLVLYDRRIFNFDAACVFAGKNYYIKYPWSEIF